jgi:hypothetical protein
MNGYRIFIIFSLGYSTGTMLFVAAGTTSKANAIISIVLLTLSWITYILGKDEDTDQIARILNKMVDNKIKQPLDERYGENHE